jgi:hypothetical protein
MTDPSLPVAAVDTSDHARDCRCQTCRTERRIEGGRRSENWLAYAGAGQAIFAGIMESLVRAGVKLGDGPVEHGIPWINLTILVICVLPKTVGRHTAGTAIAAIANRFGGKAS